MSGVLGKIGEFFAGGLVGQLADVADRFIETPEERTEFQRQIEDIITRRIESADRLEAARMEMVAKIVQADAQSGDTYTKRARPTVVYAGLATMILNYGLSPLIGAQPVELPQELWMTWGGVVGVWTLGRSGERMSAANSMTARMSGLITGGKPKDDLSAILDRSRA